MINFTGADVIDPPLVYPIGEDVTAEFNSWSEISDMCSASRLWGGLHFYVSHSVCWDFRGQIVIVR